jgi:hypothetical protein
MRFTSFRQVEDEHRADQLGRWRVQLRDVRRPGAVVGEQLAAAAAFQGEEFLERDGRVHRGSLEGRGPPGWWASGRAGPRMSGRRNGQLPLAGSGARPVPGRARPTGRQVFAPHGMTASARPGGFRLAPLPPDGPRRGQDWRELLRVVVRLGHAGAVAQLGQAQGDGEQG